MESNGLQYLAVVWRDPKSVHGWTINTADAPAKIVSVGILWHKNTRGITLLESLIKSSDVEDRYGCSMFIEWGLIEKITKLESGEEFFDFDDGIRRLGGIVGDS